MRAVGGNINERGKYTHERWVQKQYRWPQDADRMFGELMAAAAESDIDVYVCPYLMRGRRRRPEDALPPTKIHADIDGDCPLDKVTALGGWAVGSGTPGHAHVYVDLAEPIPLHWHEALCRGLGTHLGDADAKIRPNDVLRPPGTLNHKSRARGGGSSPVTWLIRPDGVTR